VKDLDWGEGYGHKHEDSWSIDNPETKDVLKEYLKLRKELKDRR